MTDEKGDAEEASGPEPTPRGVRLMAGVRWAIVILASIVAVGAWISYGREKLGTPSASGHRMPRYHCPMHPQIVSDFPGECPICHMSLEPLAAPRDAGPAIAEYMCPMHPEVRSKTPGRCPICKMDLAPVALPVSDAGADESIPAGTAPITLTLDRVQSIGVRTALVEEALTSASLRVTAVVQPPEQGTAEVHVRTPGFVEAIKVDQTGIAVGAGQPMLTLYSPEILQAQHELLAMRSWGDGGASSPARNKLELLGMPPAEIDQVLAKREPVRGITIAAPRSGFVTKKNVVLGSYVTPETTLYEIQDLSRVYVVADVFLADVQYVKAGAEARFVPSGRPEDAATGKVDLVYPQVSAEARTRRVRMQLGNAGRRAYAPGEYGLVELTTPARKGVTIPRDALVDTGAATYVFVVERSGGAEGRYVPRTVVMSGASGDRIVVGSGLVAGERVVSGATFLIDSESRLQASIGKAQGHTP